MDQFLQGVSNWFKEKTSSLFWNTLLFSFIAWNWQFVYILLGGSKENVAYICEKYFLTNEGYSCTFINASLKNPDLLWNYGGPIIVALIGMQLIPYLSNLCVRVQLKFLETRERDILKSNSSLKDRRLEKGKEIGRREAYDDMYSDPLGDHDDRQMELLYWDAEFSGWKDLPEYESYRKLLLQINDGDVSFLKKLLNNSAYEFLKLRKLCAKDGTTEKGKYFCSLMEKSESK